MQWPDLDIQKIVQQELNRAIMGTGPTWERLIQAGAEAMHQKLNEQYETIQSSDNVAWYKVNMEEQVNGTKKFYQSKTLWVNVIAALALIVGREFDFALDASELAAILAIVNIVLRIATKEPMGA